ncbi:MAG: tRNA cyclic N6-threonylcarbamoyladenosine(37) synthase TcdA [Thiohalomonadales bacterium]
MGDLDMPTEYQQRFSGLQRLYGRQAYALLADIHIAVIGLGGVGSWAVESLARSGIGKLTLIDYDDIAASNINRQIQALSDTIGQKKSRVLEQRIRQINPQIECRIIDDYITEKNHRDFLATQHHYDYVIDAIDSIQFKALMIYCCRRNKIPIVTTGGAGGVIDPSSIRIADLSKTYNDALASKVRKRLRSEFGFPRNAKRSFRVECVYSIDQKAYPKSDGTVSFAKPGIHGVHLDCEFGYGAVSFVTATFGMLAASRAVNKSIKKRLNHHAR